MVKFGVIGAGNIAKRFLTALNGLGIKPYAIASRTIEKAWRYQSEFNITKAYGSYEAMLKDADLKCVYIATPHSYHFDHMKLALNYGKHVLCEKPFTLNKKEALEIITLAKTNHLLVMEAMKTRFLPVIHAVKQHLDKGVIGEITKMEASFSTVEKTERLYDNALGGGALLDIGVYPLTLAHDLFGELEYGDSTVTLKNGVDIEETLYLKHDTIDITITLSMLTPLKKDATIYGTKGKIVIPHYSSANTAIIYNTNQDLIKRLNVPHQVNGFEYQIQSFIKTIEENTLENKTMPHQFTLIILSLMDQIRQEWNLVYPNEAL